MNQIGGIPFANYLWNGPQILAWFFLFSALIIFLSKININFIQIIAMKKNLSPVFIGGIVLSVLTSLPEFVTSIFAGVEDKINLSSPPTGAIFSYFNVTGANALQAFILGLFALFIFILICSKTWKKNKTKEKKEIKNYFSSNLIKRGWQTYYTLEFCNFYGGIISQIVNNKMIIIIVAIFQYAMTIIILKVPVFANVLNVNGFNFLNLLWLLLWIAFLIWTIFQKSTDNEYDAKLQNSWWWKRPFSLLLTSFAIFGSLFAFFTYLNAGIVKNFESVLGIQGNIAAGLILSIATSLPEISSFLLLTISKKYDTAVSGILGSTFFNNSLPFVANVVSLRSFYNEYPNIINEHQGTEAYKMAIQIVPWCSLLIIITALLGIGSYKKVANKPFLSVPILTMVVVGYIAGFVFTSSLS